MAKRRLKILTYNIHQGLTAYRQKIGFAHLREALRMQNPDIVLLQEVAGVRPAGRKKERRERERRVPYQLDALVDRHWPYSAYGVNSIFPGGFHGNAILSRIPILKSHNTDITSKGLIKRGLLHAEIEWAEGPEPIKLHMISTHFGLMEYERKKQVSLLCQYVANHVPEGAPLVIGGDFNDWRERCSAQFARRSHLKEVFQTRQGRHARSFPARLPVLKLDRIYFRGCDVAAASRPSGRPWLFLSDHLPLVAEFHLD